MYSTLFFTQQSVIAWDFNDLVRNVHFEMSLTHLKELEKKDFDHMRSAPRHNLQLFSISIIQRCSIHFCEDIVISRKKKKTTFYIDKLEERQSKIKII